MSWLGSSYLALNLLLLAATLLLVFADILIGVLPAQTKLRLHYGTLAVLSLLSALSCFLPAPDFLSPQQRDWTEKLKPSSIRFDFKLQRSASPEIKNPPRTTTSYFLLFSLGLILGGGLFSLYRVYRSQRVLNSILRRAWILKTIGRVRLLVSDEVEVPFAYRTLKNAYAVIPESLAADSAQLRLALSHELQHHRQGDTLALYVFQFLRFICFFNPAIYFWQKWIGEIQEFACDEALVGRRGFSTEGYARCLIQVAETAMMKGSIPFGTAGMVLLNQGNLLNRRIQSMFSKSKTQPRWKVILLGITITGGLTSTAFATKAFVQDRRVTLAQAQGMLQLATTNGKEGFPLVVNEEVLKYLNFFIGTPQGRERMRLGLQRMANYQNMVSAKITEYQVPTELMAIPLIESGYQNLPERNQPGWGAGLWMFIKSTARVYGLTVTPQRDQRLDEALLTDAAMRFLLANKLRFKDWSLAVLAYNAGGNAIQGAIEQSGSRDPWDLVRHGGLSDEAKNYLPKLIAAMIVMRNPSSVE